MTVRIEKPNHVVNLDPRKKFKVRFYYKQNKTFGVHVDDWLIIKAVLVVLNPVEILDDEYLELARTYRTTNVKWDDRYKNTGIPEPDLDFFEKQMIDDLKKYASKYISSDLLDLSCEIEKLSHGNCIVDSRD